MADTNNPAFRTGSTLMLVGALSFVGYGLVFFLRSFTGAGFELGVETIGGLTQADVNSFNASIVPYINHLHIAAAGFITATGIAVAALSHYGVRQGMLWAWIAAVVSPVVGLAVALPMHYLNLFEHNWVTHLGPIYLGTAIFVAGALMTLKGFIKKSKPPMATEEQPTQ